MWFLKEQLACTDGYYYKPEADYDIIFNHQNRNMAGLIEFWGKKIHNRNKAEIMLLIRFRNDKYD